MSRSLTVIAIALTGAVSFGLYQLSYEVQHREDELAELNRALVQERENIEVLRAEWSYVTRPDYLQDKAQRNLEMRPTVAKQIVGFADLPTRQQRITPDSPGAGMVSAKPKADPKANAGKVAPPALPSVPVMAPQPPPVKPAAPTVTASAPPHDALATAVLASMRKVD